MKKGSIYKLFRSKLYGLGLTEDYMTSYQDERDKSIDDKVVKELYEFFDDGNLFSYYALTNGNFSFRNVLDHIVESMYTTKNLLIPDFNIKGNYSEVFKSLAFYSGEKEAEEKWTKFKEQYDNRISNISLTGGGISGLAGGIGLIAQGILTIPTNSTPEAILSVAVIALSIAGGAALGNVSTNLYTRKEFKEKILPELEKYADEADYFISQLKDMYAVEISEHPSHVEGKYSGKMQEMLKKYDETFAFLSKYENDEINLRNNLLDASDNEGIQNYSSLDKRYDNLEEN